MRRCTRCSSMGTACAGSYRMQPGLWMRWKQLGCIRMRLHTLW
uniref:Uncharacterized protein n=1 Tax=Arundo donax TaxID=35708 RepID=A0A0A9CL44_ARUDO